MVPLLTKQAVDLKVRRQFSVIVGNYEFYYALGLYSAGHPEVDLRGNMSPGELKDALMKELDPQEFLPANDPDKYLCFLLHRYRVEDDAHDQVMEGLFEWARSGVNPFPSDAQ